MLHPTWRCAPSRDVWVPSSSLAPRGPDGSGDGVGGFSVRWMVVCRFSQPAMASRAGV